MITRTEHLRHLELALERSPVTALLGPRQCGKTTLARQIASSLAHKFPATTYLDLESTADFQKLQNPEIYLKSLSGLVVLDEAQTLPGLFNVLRPLVDRPDNPCRFLVLGSASPTILTKVSESLAGRVEFVELSGFHTAEIAPRSRDDLWVRGGFPRSFLARSLSDSQAWRHNFIRTFLERDIPQLGINVAAVAMRRFWTMLAHSHGQTWNSSELARSMSLSDKTVRHYLDILTGTFMVRQLQPWFANIKKRQVKSPKIYIRDSGILHSLLSIEDMDQLLGHPRLGASWEGFALEETLAALDYPEAYFWATHAGAELDLLFQRRGKRFGVEFKFSDAPKLTRSMRTALSDLELEHLWVVHPGSESYPMDEGISALSLAEVQTLKSPPDDSWPG